MSSVFLKALEMSIVGTYSTLFVLTARLFLSKVSRKYCYILWVVVFINPILPFSLVGKFSLIPEQLVNNVQIVSSTNDNTAANQAMQSIQTLKTGERTKSIGAAGLAD